MWQSIITAAATVSVALIELFSARARKKQKQEEEKERTASMEREQAREKMMLLIMQGNGAAIALGEATAHAIQRGHANGDMEEALSYATQIKHQQKDFLTQQGIHAILE